MNWIREVAEEIAAIAYNGPLTGCRAQDVITAHAAPLVALLREARREHAREEICERSVYGDGPPLEDMACTCGADAFNARLDAVLNA